MTTRDAASSRSAWHRDLTLETWMLNIRILDLPQQQATLQPLTRSQVDRIIGGSGSVPSPATQQDRQIVKGNKWGSW